VALEDGDGSPPCVAGFLTASEGIQCIAKLAEDECLVCVIPERALESGECPLVVVDGILKMAQVEVDVTDSALGNAFPEPIAALAPDRQRLPKMAQRLVMALEMEQHLTDVVENDTRERSFA